MRAGAPGSIAGDGSNLTFTTPAPRSRPGHCHSHHQRRDNCGRHIHLPPTPDPRWVIADHRSGCWGNRRDGDWHRFRGWVDGVGGRWCCDHAGLDRGRWERFDVHGPGSCRRAGRGGPVSTGGRTAHEHVHLPAAPSAQFTNANGRSDNWRHRRDSHRYGGLWLGRWCRWATADHAGVDRRGREQSDVHDPCSCRRTGQDHGAHRRWTTAVGVHLLAAQSSSLLPIAGPVAGGTVRDSHRYGVCAGSMVSVGGGAPITPGSIAGDGSGLAFYDSGSCGRTVGVTVSTGGGTTAVGTFTYLPLPVLVSLLPIAGPVAGGTVVTVAGSGSWQGRQCP